MDISKAICMCFIELNTRQRNLPPKIEVTNEDRVRVRFNEPWIEMIKLVDYTPTVDS